MTTLEDRLTQLADRLTVPREDDGTPAELRALMPCEPAVGEVAVVCWTDSGGGELVELVRLDSGEPLDDQAALRESLALLAMVETVEELASFDATGALRTELAAWVPPVGAAQTAIDGVNDARDRALVALDAVTQLDPGDEPRIARTSMLDALAAALRALEDVWQRLEQAAELWSDAHRAAHRDGADAMTAIQDLWRMLGAARRGPLRTPVATSLHSGREAGVAMAAELAARA